MVVVKVVVKSKSEGALATFPMFHFHSISIIIYSCRLRPPRHFSLLNSLGFGSLLSLHDLINSTPSSPMLLMSP